MRPPSPVDQGDPNDPTVIGKLLELFGDNPTLADIHACADDDVASRTSVEVRTLQQWASFIAQVMNLQWVHGDDSKRMRVRKVNVAVFCHCGINWLNSTIVLHSQLTGEYKEVANEYIDTHAKAKLGIRKLCTMIDAAIRFDRENGEPVSGGSKSGGKRAGGEE